MKHLAQRLASVVDVTTTADSARLGRWLALFAAVVIGASSWYVDTASAVEGTEIEVRKLLVVLGLLVLAGPSAWLPWDGLPRWAALLYPMTSFVLLALLGVVAGQSGAAYVGLFTIWFMFIGLTQSVGTGWRCVPAAALAWVLLMGGLNPQTWVRLGLAALVWTVVAEVLAVRGAKVDARQQDLTLQADTDPLTGLLNRRALERSLEALTAGDVVVVIDIDHFKAVNDRFGHEGGDRVLVDFASALGAVVRQGDVVARYGGEEFVLVLPTNNVLGVGAASVLSRLRGGWARKHPEITWSAGATCHVVGEEPHQTLRIADRAMYEAKQTGRDRVVTSGEARELAGVATHVR